MQFKDRYDAGQRLAEKLARYKGQPDALVLALPRGGVPVAYEVAEALGAPLDVFLVRKLGVPGHRELAMGAIASGGVRYINDDVVRSLDLDEDAIERVSEVEAQELERREREYRAGRPSLDVRAKTVILVDDGLATGSSMHAAVAALRRLDPTRIVVAVPVGSPEVRAGLEAVADEVICLQEPEYFHAVGSWYEDFAQTTDDEVRELLARNETARAT